MMIQQQAKECLLAEEPADCRFCCCRCSKQDCPVRCELDKCECEYYAGEDHKGYNYLRLVA